MIFPFSIKRKVVLNQAEYGITSESYIIAQLEDSLDEYGMMKQRLSDSEIFYVTMNPIRTGAFREILRNVRVKVITDNSNILIRIETETIFAFFVGFIPLMMYPIKALNMSFVITTVACSILWLMGYGIKLIAISQVKKDVRVQMEEFRKNDNRNTE